MELAISLNLNEFLKQNPFFMNEIKILKNRSDIGAGTRGSDMGIDAL